MLFCCLAAFKHVSKIMFWFTQVLKTMFDKLAHASIMRLNSNSMDKLYDLMTMAVKYQVHRETHKQHSTTCPSSSKILKNEQKPVRATCRC